MTIRSIKKIATLGVVCGLLTLLGSCEEEELLPGAALVDGEPFQTLQEEFAISARNKSYSAAPTNQLPLYQLGNISNDFFGNTSASIVTGLRLPSSVGIGRFVQSVEEEAANGTTTDVEDSTNDVVYTSVAENERVVEVYLHLPYQQSFNAGVDADGDGLVAYLDVDDSDVNSDSDGDGVLDFQEVIEGSDPNDPDSNSGVEGVQSKFFSNYCRTR